MKGERDCFVGASLTAKPDYHWTSTERTSMSATLLDTTAVRARFTALQRRLAFFDGPGGTQCPDEVIDAIAELPAPRQRERRRTLRDLSPTSALVDLAHEKAGAFLGCSGDEWRSVRA